MSLAFENPKDPATIANYSIDWTDLIIPMEIDGEMVADTILSHRVQVVTGEVPVLDETSDLLIRSSTVEGYIVIAMLAGGTAGQTYRIECEVTLESGQVFNREARLKVKNL